MYPPLPYNVLLIGFMGTGKTTIARALSKKLQVDWVDLDRLIVDRAGMPITEIFETQGEPAFRALETQILEELSEKTGMIISCGGGVAMQPQNLPLLKKGKVILLTASPYTILRRVSHRNHRPLLQNRMNVPAIKELMEERQPHYKAVANIVIKTDGKPVSAICAQIIKRLYPTRLQSNVKVPRS